ncbi:MAG: hypothetical protein A3H94_05895 [Acidobacteria bacterium RIFCSPLOWO2_02_FULL_60_20]|nr:MAG: hypothetical protein A3H94_05895 [Acidobacteria bacterium RIFCSPLOWO2_02_FULL_60_20]
MPIKTRPKLSKTLEKRVFQQAGSRCAFCSEAEIVALEIHHIDGDPANNVIENLLLVCASCHTKITSRVFSEIDVTFRKRQLQQGVPPKLASQPTVSVSITGSQFRGDIANTIIKTSHRSTPRTKHPDGSLGADIRKKGYVDYLIAKYFEFRKADISYGRRGRISYAELHKTIQREFGCRTFYTPVEAFPRLVDFLQVRIDPTILGKNNSSRGVPNYRTYEAHLQKFNLGSG